MHEQKITADIAYEKVIQQQRVIEIYKEAFSTQNYTIKENLRNELYELLSPMYKNLKKRGVLQFHFIFPNNISFLRFHKIKKFDDDLSDIRPDFKYVNETHKGMRGFIQGRTAHAFRNVYPIFDQNEKYVGAMEVSFSSEYLQNNFSEIADIHTHFLVNKDVFLAKTWKRDELVINYITSLENENYMVSMPNSHDNKKYHTSFSKKIKNIQSEINKNLLIAKPFALFTNNKQNNEVISFLPIQNKFTREVLAWVVSYEQDNFIEATINNNYYIRITLFILLSILFYFIYKTLIHKQYLEEVVSLKTNELKELNENLEQKITFEVEKSKEMEAKLFHSEKMVSMGEMIGNIAHQWRQPLSAISTGATGMKMQKEYGLLSDADFFKTCDSINKHSQYLSQTIDDFKNYIKGDRDKQIFTLKSDIDTFMHLIEGSLKKENINIIVNIDREISIDGYPNELVQCFINLYNNSKDAFIEQETIDKYIFISSTLEKDTVKIYFKDNASGIKKSIITKIFDPYFTTRHKSQGTGLGLHMSYNLIVEGMKGNIEVYNRTFDYKNTIYTGAEFIITLPR